MPKVSISAIGKYLMGYFRLSNSIFADEITKIQKLIKYEQSRLRYNNQPEQFETDSEQQYDQNSQYIQQKQRLELLQQKAEKQKKKTSKRRQPRVHTDVEEEQEIIA